MVTRRLICAKCGIDAINNPSAIFHGFPRPCKSILSLLRTYIWATYIYPAEDWSSLDSLKAFFKRNLSLCNNHFDDSAYVDSEKRLLIKFALPSDTEHLVRKWRNGELDLNFGEDNIPLAAFYITKAIELEHNYCLKPEEGSIQSREHNYTINKSVESGPTALVPQKHWPLKRSAIKIPLLYPERSEEICESNKESSDKENVAGEEEGENACDTEKQSSNEETICLLEEIENESETSKEFSWNKGNIACTLDDDETLSQNSHENAMDSMYEESIPSNNVLDNKQNTDTRTTFDQHHIGYTCNECKGQIHRFRYTCIQCSDYDICCMCEARGVHDTHYMLRIPRPRPPSEIQGVLTALRAKMSKLIAEFGDSLADIESIIEIKHEEEDPVPELVTVPPTAETLDDLSDTEGELEEEDCAATESGGELNRSHEEECEPHESEEQQETYVLTLMDENEIKEEEDPLSNLAETSASTAKGQDSFQIIVTSEPKASYCKSVSKRKLEENDQNDSDILLKSMRISRVNEDESEFDCSDLCDNTDVRQAEDLVPSVEVQRNSPTSLEDLFLIKSQFR